jgi:hypothetical protein
MENEVKIKETYENIIDVTHNCPYCKRIVRIDKIEYPCKNNMLEIICFNCGKKLLVWIRGIKTITVFKVMVQTECKSCHKLYFEKSDYELCPNCFKRVMSGQNVVDG